MCVLMAGLAGCSRTPLAPPLPASGLPASGEAPQFVNAAATLGIAFTHFNGAAGKKYMPETVGSGCAIFDYDNDGWMDVLFVSGTSWTGDIASRQKLKPSLALFKNHEGRRFENVTRAAGLWVSLCGMGAAVGDYDNDGFADVYVTGVGDSRLFHNNGNGTFRDVTKAAGVRVTAWGMSAVWFDMDRDGDLDLFVPTYVDWTVAHDQFCRNSLRQKTYCGPDAYPGSPHVLFRNDGGGKFSNVTAAAGVGTPTAKGMGAVAFDIDADGALDLLVANDRVPANVYVNDGTGHFTDVGPHSGMMYGEVMGQSVAGMGIEVADVRNDGTLAVLISNYAGEGLAFFVQQEPTRFTQRSRAAGLFQASIDTLGFGVVFADVNNDGWADAFVANGHVQDDIEQFVATTSFQQKPLLFLNDGQGGFEDKSAAAGADAQQAVVGRGVAVGDLNNDGWLDLVVNTNNGPAQVFINQPQAGRHWLSVRLEGKKSGRDAFGARVEVTVAGVTQRRWAMSGGSYLSSRDPRVHFGLGSQTRVERLRVRWPSGETEEFTDVEADQMMLIREGQGIVARAPAGAAAPEFPQPQGDL